MIILDLIGVCHRRGVAVLLLVRFESAHLHAGIYRGAWDDRECRVHFRKPIPNVAGQILGASPVPTTMPMRLVLWGAR